jgi:hypothetical protein
MINNPTIKILRQWNKWTWNILTIQLNVLYLFFGISISR